MEDVSHHRRRLYQRGRGGAIARASGQWMEGLENRLLLAVDVLSWRYNQSLTGLNDQETILTPSNVVQATFGKLFSQPVDGQMYAQPLYVSNLNMPGVGVRNVLYAATEHNTVYAFNADAPGAALWQVSLNPPGATSIPYQDTGVADLSPEIGITGTPVIDNQTKTLYVVARTKENGTYVQRLHALDLYTGAEKFGGAKAITAPNFYPLKQNQRCALTLSNGVVYIAWASHGDVDPYWGYVIAYDATTLNQLAIWNAEGDSAKGGIWMSGAAPSVDSDGNLYLMTGNGTFNGNTGGLSWGQSVVKLKLVQAQNGTYSFNVVDYFTPFNYLALDTGDTDLGSGGLMLLPDQPGPNPHLVIGGGKQGRVYLMNRDNLGHLSSGYDNIVQTLDSQFGPIYSTAAYFNGSVYMQGTADNLKRYALTNGQLATSYTAMSPTRIDFPGSSPVISANGTANGIVWSYQFGQTAVLHAYRSDDLTELYNSNQAGPRDVLGAGVKFSNPIVANGKVYVGGSTALTVFGNVNIPPTIPNAPSNLVATAVDSTHVNLTWNDNSGNEIGFTIERSTDGQNFSSIGSANANITTFTDATTAGNTTYTYRIKAISNAGSSTPAVASPVTTPALPFVGYWQLNEGNGATAGDASGNNINGTIYGETTWVDGRVGSGALNFHGAGVQDAHVEANDNAAIKFTAAQDFTLSAWVNSGGFRNKWAGIVTKSADQAGGYGLYTTPLNHWAFAGASSDGNALIDPSVATLGWHHLAAVQHGNGVRELWVDGVMVASGTLGGVGVAANANGAGKFYIGGSAGTIQEFFGGAVDDVRIYSRALAGSELASLAGGYNPAAPANLSASSLSNSSIKLTWQDLSSNETGFTIERSTDNVQFNPVTTVGAGVTTYTNTGLLASTRYYYRIKAVNTDGSSAYTPVVNAITQISLAVAQYGFVEGAGLVTTDSSGHGNTGTLNGGVTWTPQGRVGYGLNMDGTGYVTVANSASVNPTAGLSLSVWVKASQWNGGSRIIAKGNNDDQYEIFSSSGYLGFKLVSIGLVSTLLPSVGVWHHLAATYDNATMKLYIDGALVASAAGYGAMLTTNDPLYLGTKAAHGTQFDSFQGTMDEVYVFDRPLTQAEITALANPVTEPNDPANLVASAVSTTQIDLTWSDNSTDEQYWLIERSTDNADWAPIAMAPPGTSPTYAYSDTTASLGTRYYYRVRAHNSAGDSEYSNVATALTPLDGDPPTVVTAATATPSGHLTGKTAALSALGADNNGETALTYTWTTYSAPAGAPAPVFSGNTNGTNAAKNITVTLGRAGSYTFDVSIADASGLKVSSRVTVIADQTAASILVTPGSTVLAMSAPQQFAASLRDQFGDMMPSQPGFVWSVQAGGSGGTITAGGLYTSPSGLGSDIVEARAAGLLGTAVVSVNPGPQFPTGFSNSTGLTLRNGAQVTGGRLRLTTAGSSTWDGGAFFTTKVLVSGFVTDFTYQATNATADGFTFTIQNQAANVFGNGGSGLGYYGITPSVALAFPILGGTQTGLWTNGVLGNKTSVSNIDLRNSHYYAFHITYDGTTLKVKITDTNTNATASQQYTVNIPSIVGGTTAWMGFTGGIAVQYATQEITAWTYRGGPPDETPPTIAASSLGYASHPHTYKVTFSENVAASLTPTKLSVQKTPSGAVYTPVSVTFDQATNVATFTFASDLPNGNYNASIASGTVADGAGNLLASGYSANFFVLAGDIDRDGTVGFSDLVLVAQNYDTQGGATWATGDLNGDGNVDFGDLVILAQNYDTSVPTSAPVVEAAPAVVANVATTPVSAPVMSVVPSASVVTSKPVVAPVITPVKQTTPSLAKPPAKSAVQMAIKPVIKPPTPARKVILPPAPKLVPPPVKVVATPVLIKAPVAAGVFSSAKVKKVDDLLG